ncbi:hypothetical protein GIB67_041562 [Kingdonia uniflora]|uniref:Uncharacterized protein n=1 Tax=Kingdonia uniflora TaxID=39325 RepID=A0A7J7MQD9_9MAGN|nr:hypothetical protein GIB67_041562 [Kingdonia uniflora]
MGNRKLVQVLESVGSAKSSSSKWYQICTVKRIKLEVHKPEFYINEGQDTPLWGPSESEDFIVKSSWQFWRSKEDVQSRMDWIWCSYSRSGNIETLDHLIVNGEIALRIISWEIRKARCKQRLEGDLMNAQSIVTKICRWLQDIMIKTKVTQGCSFGDTLSLQVLRKDQLRLSGAEGIIRDSHEEMKLGYSIALGNGTNMIAELYRLLHGLILCKENHWFSLVVEMVAKKNTSPVNWSDTTEYSDFNDDDVTTDLKNFEEEEDSDFDGSDEEALSDGEEVGDKSMMNSDTSEESCTKDKNDNTNANEEEDHEELPVDIEARNFFAN